MMRNKLLVLPLTGTKEHNQFMEILNLLLYPLLTIHLTFKYFLQMKAAEGAQYSTEQAIKLEMELVELKAERTVMSLRVGNVSANLESKAPRLITC